MFSTMMLALNKITKCVKCSSCVSVYFCRFGYALTNGMFACSQDCQIIPLFTMSFCMETMLRCRICKYLKWYVFLWE